MPDLRAVVVMDYQNVHLTAHELFAASRNLPRHESLIDPLHFANQLIIARNRAQWPGMDHPVLRRALVYRGQPSAEHDPKPYARNGPLKASANLMRARTPRAGRGVQRRHPNRLPRARG